MRVLRTPESCFSGLSDFAFAPHYVDIASGPGPLLRMGYVDEGPRDAPVILMLHGEPTWSFLYRRMIAIFKDAGFRAVAPDLIGFGRSDKPAERDFYTYQHHVDWMWCFVEKTQLKGITLFCQDWGGLIGLRLVAEHPERFDRVVASNTALPTGDHPVPDSFLRWQRYSQEAPSLPIGEIIKQHCTRLLSPKTVRGYEAPFPDEEHKVAARQFPLLVPTHPNDPASKANRHAWRSLESFEKPFLTLFSDGDPLTAGTERILQKRIPGCKGLAHEIIRDAGHFVQEDASEELARKTISLARL